MPAVRIHAAPRDFRRRARRPPMWAYRPRIQIKAACAWLQKSGSSLIAATITMVWMIIAMMMRHQKRRMAARHSGEAP